MFDFGTFKLKIQEWIRENPSSSEFELVAVCKKLIPEEEKMKQWLIYETVSWYRYFCLVEEQKKWFCD